MRIDRPDDGSARPDAPNAPDAPEARGADAADDAEPMRGAAAEQGGAERDGASQGDDASAARVARNLEYRATVEAVNRAYAIDQGYTRVQEIEEKTVTPAMRRIEAEDPERTLAGLENRLKGKELLGAVIDDQNAGFNVHIIHR